MACLPSHIAYDNWQKVLHAILPWPLFNSTILAQLLFSLLTSFPPSQSRIDHSSSIFSDVPCETFPGLDVVVSLVKHTLVADISALINGKCF